MLEFSGYTADADTVSGEFNTDRLTIRIIRFIPESWSPQISQIDTDFD
jgi:hypothetical protein